MGTCFIYVCLLMHALLEHTIFVTTGGHIVLVVGFEIISVGIFEILIIFLVDVHVKGLASLSVEMLKQLQTIATDSRLEIRVGVVVIICVKNSLIGIHQFCGDRRL